MRRGVGQRIASPYVKRFPKHYVMPEWHSLTGAGNADQDTKAIAAALGEGLEVRLAAQQYLISLQDTMTTEAGATPYMLRIPASGGVIRGVPRKTVLKTAPNQSTDLSPTFYARFCANGVVDGLDVYGVDFDDDAANNPISPNRGSDVYNYFNQAAFMISGSTPTVGVDARLINGKFRNSHFKNSAGISSLLLGQTNKDRYGSRTFTTTIAAPGVITLVAHGYVPGQEFIPSTTGALPTGYVAGAVHYIKTVRDADTFTLAATLGGAEITTSGTQSGVHSGRSVGSVLGYNNDIIECLFFDNGLDANDHSSLYLWYNKGLFTGNVFGATVMSSGKRGPNVMAELHGSDLKFVGNHGYNYPYGVIVSGNYTEVSRRQLVAQSGLVVCQKAIWGIVDNPAEYGCADFIGAHNHIRLTADNWVGGVYKSAIDLTPSYGKFDNPTLDTNTIESLDTNGAVGVALAARGAGTTLKNVNVHGQTYKGLSIGTRVGVAGGAGSVNGSITENKMIEPRATTIFGSPIGTYIANASGSLWVAENQSPGSTLSVLTEAIAITGDYHADNNLGGSYVENGGFSVSGARSGNQALP